MISGPLSSRYMVSMIKHLGGEENNSLSELLLTPHSS